MSAAPYNIIGGRPPFGRIFPYEWKSQVKVEETKEQIIISGPMYIVIDKTRPTMRTECDDSYPCVIEGRLKGVAVISDMDDTHIRCDSIEDLGFWFEMSGKFAIDKRAKL